ncbi:transcriptional activator NhaR [Curvibacter sp. CHRR-16]|uniref:transcriptional activator NhaR n=1 Tax=Curvibacter sp. CHRR-16 TaxID=2835872 RepID=UPI001BD92649|nr:transcriptional activator NhaR [Curvibacter sp. CHRR-16]MBT0570169.1 transcriptional activator NhaR [Curvibacter sp. CHRR-16]
MNFKHLHYFWMAAKAGGVVKAGEQLHTTPQTLSGQIKLLEDWLGRKLFQKSGRNLELTEDGRLALGYAEQIFQLGADLENAIRQPRGTERTLDFRVGVADSVVKSLAYRLLEPALHTQHQVRLICHEGKFTDLLARLALNQLDMVLADEPMSKRLSVKAFNHPLGQTAMSFFCTPALKSTLQGAFPACLDNAPVLLQGAQASVRQQWEGWLSKYQIQPLTVGEFDDSALMTAFARQGRGVFMAPRVMEPDIMEQFGVEVIGRSDELTEEFFAITVERRITHPCVAAITASARDELFRARSLS